MRAVITGAFKFRIEDLTLRLATMKCKLVTVQPLQSSCLSLLYPSLSPLPHPRVLALEIISATNLISLPEVYVFLTFLTPSDPEIKKKWGRGRLFCLYFMVYAKFHHSVNIQDSSQQNIIVSDIFFLNCFLFCRVIRIDT